MHAQKNPLQHVCATACDAHVEFLRAAGGKFWKLGSETVEF